MQRRGCVCARARVCVVCSVKCVCVDMSTPIVLNPSSLTSTYLVSFVS